ncbi:MFS general substrate transporter [Cadophora sp. DSE1049]|nr:MFS general substrate transporter [Cadophora sp. DSE1049]
MQQVWGKHGKKYIFTAYTTFSTYYNYAISDFNRIASSSALSVACNLSFSLLKPIWAKSSDLYGRAAIYPVALGFVTLGLVLAASAKGFGQFSLGTVLRVWGITALNTLNTTVIADITTTRQRGFGVNFQFFPYLVLPWVSAFIVSDIVSPGGIGWAWGIGIIAIIFPFGICAITFLLFKYQRRAKKLEAALFQRPRMTISEAASAIDLGGLVIIIFAFAFILIPLSLAALQPQGFKTSWVIALIVLGGVLLLALPVYEKFIPAQPFVPWSWLTHKSIGLAFLLYFSDYMAAAASHNFIYNWALIAHNFTIVQAVNLSYISSVMVFCTGMLFGLVMWKTKQYKWWIMGGAVIRIIGYGVMFRVRTANPSKVELFIVQLIQGLGNGIVQTGGYVAAVVNVPHSKTAQMASLVVMIGTLGGAIGTAISGAIYTNTFREELAKALGDNSTPELIDALFNSITSTLIPAWGTVERTAINTAFDKVTSYFFIAAMAIIVPCFPIIWYLPNQTLNDSQNLIEENGILGGKIDLMHRTTTAEDQPSVQAETKESKEVK